mgnify:CR=1 FL=1
MFRKKTVSYVSVSNPAKLMFAMYSVQCVHQLPYGVSIIRCLPKGEASLEQKREGGVREGAEGAMSSSSSDEEVIMDSEEFLTKKLLLVNNTARATSDESETGGDKLASEVAGKSVRSESR